MPDFVPQRQRFLLPDLCVPDQCLLPGRRHLLTCAAAQRKLLSQAQRGKLVTGTHAVRNAVSLQHGLGHTLQRSLYLACATPAAVDIPVMTANALLPSYCCTDRGTDVTEGPGSVPK